MFVRRFLERGVTRLEGGVTLLERLAEKEDSPVLEGVLQKNADGGHQQQCLKQQISEQHIQLIERLTDKVRCSEIWMQEQEATVQRLQDRVGYLELRLEGELIKRMSAESEALKRSQEGLKHRPEHCSLRSKSADSCVSESNGANRRRARSRDCSIARGDDPNGSCDNSVARRVAPNGGIGFNSSTGNIDIQYTTGLDSPPETNHGIIHSATLALTKPVRLATMPVRYAGYYAGHTALAPYRVFFGMMGKVNGLIDRMCFRTIDQVEGLIDSLQNEQLVKADELLEGMHGETIPKMNKVADDSIGTPHRRLQNMVEKSAKIVKSSANIPGKVDGLLDQVQNGPLKQVEGMLSYADKSTLKKVDNLVDLLRVLVLLFMFGLFCLGIWAFLQMIHEH